MMDLAQRNELRLAALGRVSAADRKKHKLGRILEVAGDSPESAVYFLNFNITHGVNLATLKLAALAKLPALGARVNRAFGAHKEANATKIKEFLLRPELARLRALDFSTANLAKASDAFAKSPHLSSLTWLDLADTSVKLDSLLKSTVLGNVEYLNISHNQLGTADLLKVLESSALPRLADLDFSSANLQDGLEKVAAAPGLARLRALSLRYCNRKSWAALTKSKHLAGLRRLDLAGTPLDDGGTRLLAHGGFESLTEINLACHGDAFAKIALPALERLHLSVDSPKVIEALAKDPALARLHHLGLTLTWQAAKAVPALYASPAFRKLTSLALTFEKARSPDEAAVLCRLPPFERLERLELCGIDLDEARVADMLRDHPLKNLRELALSAEIVPAAAAALAGCADLAKLESLRIVGGWIKDEGTMAFAASPYMKSLAVLDFGQSSMTGKGVLALAESDNLSRLIELNVSGAFVSSSPKARKALLEHAKMPKLWVLQGLGDTTNLDLRT